MKSSSTTSLPYLANHDPQSHQIHEARHAHPFAQLITSEVSQTSFTESGRPYPVPLDIIIYVASYMSVRDICRIRMARSNRRWFLHPIHTLAGVPIFLFILRLLIHMASSSSRHLSLKPIQRLQQLQSPVGTERYSDEDLLNLVMRLARNDFRFGNPVHKLRVLTEWQHASVSNRWKLLPGGRFYFLVSQDAMRVHDMKTHAVVLQLSYAAMLESFEIVSYSLDEVLIATLEAGGCLDTLRANIYLCEPSKGTFSLYSQTPGLTFHNSVMSLTRNALLLVSQKRNNYEALYQNFKSQERNCTFELRGIDCSSRTFSVDLLSDRYFFLNTRNGLYLYEIRDVTAPSSSSIPIEPKWSIQGSVPVWSQPSSIIWKGTNEPFGPPQTFAAWTGRSVLKMDRVGPGVKDFTMMSQR